MVLARAYATLIAALFLALNPVALYAQALGAEPLTVRIAPAYPRPYQTVQVSAQSSLVNLAASTVRISANGTLVREVSGTESAQVTLGGPGTATTIGISVTGPDGSYQKTVTIRPADVALIVDPLSTAHPFYGGGSLIPSEGRVRLVAMPDFRTASGARLDPAQLVYTWKAGDRLLTAESGVGKSTLLAQAPVRYRDTKVSVRVSTADGSIASESETTISPIDPALAIYRMDPLLGPDFANAITGSYAMSDDEASFRAVPYFFASAPTLFWSMNASPAGTKPDVTVRTTGSQSGSATLSVEAGGNGLELTRARSSFSVFFNASDDSSGFFGL